MGKTPSANPTYGAVHQRLKAKRGPASDHECICGRPAAHWAYKHTDDKPLEQDGLLYSADLDHYGPLCRKCHWAFDRKMAV